MHASGYTVVGLALLLVRSASSSEFEYVAQQRELCCWVSVFQCFEDAFADASAPDFGRFDETATAEVDCVTDAGLAHAEQVSTLAPTAITASGLASSTTLMSAFDFMIAEGWSDVRVDFALAERTRVVVSGELTAVATSDIEDPFFWVFARLELREGETVFDEHEALGVANRPKVTRSIDEVHLLDEGAYTVFIRALASYTDAVEVTGTATSSYAAAIRAFDVADIDLDGAVGFTDLLALLSAWGHCPPDETCPADLDGDGVVLFGDLLTLLARWG